MENHIAMKEMEGCRERGEQQTGQDSSNDKGGEDQWEARRELLGVITVKAHPLESGARTWQIDTLVVGQSG